MRVLVTNDDGVLSPGLRTLAEVAVAADLEVVTAAPASEYSGSSASLTALEEDGRFVVQDLEPLADGVERSLGVQASPAFIAMAAMTGAFGPAPGLVLSGINLGPNTGHAILHSGTVGAALTAATHVCPAVAFSLAGGQPTRFDTASAIAHRVLRWVLDREVPPDLVLNVNVPDVPPEQLRGLRSAELAAFGAVQANLASIGHGFASITYERVDAELEPDTDAALLEDGWATVTALAAPCVAPGVGLASLTDPVPLGVGRSG